MKSTRSLRSVFFFFTLSATSIFPGANPLLSGETGAHNSNSVHSAVTPPCKSVGTALPMADDPPALPALIGPADQSTQVATGPTLTVHVTDPDGQALEVTFFGRRKLSEANDFMIVGLPDTQYYTGDKNGGSPEIFYSQTQWITDNLEVENIVFVSQLGDCVENGDEVEDEWKAADTAMRIIEDPLTTYLADGIPYGIAVGNHDQTPFGNPAGTTELYNAYFGEPRFSGRNYYGGHYGTNNDNHYQLFSASGMDFIAIHLEYDPNANADVLNWADELLQTHPDRRAIIVSHFIIIFGNPGLFGPQGQAIYNKFKDNSNVFLMLCGHVPGEGRRTDTYNGNSIHTLLSDYQSRPYGGSGWLRLMKFSPAENTISVKTYSPWLNEWETDSDSEFALTYNMDDAGYEEIGFVADVPSGSVASVEWPDLDPNAEYEWYVAVDDGTGPVKGPVWSFTTGDHRLDLKVNLEGPYAGGSMSNTLGGSLPLNQPYFVSPWNYSGTESIAIVPADVADWVLVELRQAADAASAESGTVITRFAGLLKTDGHIVTANDQSLPAFSNPLTQKLYAVVRHRNHLAIMSAIPLTNQSGVFEFDFTTDPDKTYGGISSLKQISSGTWAMIAGDANADGIVDSNDKGLWGNSAGTNGYLSGDLNLNIEIDNRDKNDYWLMNLNASSQVPQ